MNTIFLPYTTFQVAAFIRVLLSEDWRSDNFIILYGLGTIKNIENNIYIKFLIKQLEIKNVKVIKIKINSIDGVCKFIMMLSRKFEFVTGNLRRTPSLFIAKYAQNIVALDDGIGTSICGGYFDRNYEEKSKLKKFLIRCKIIMDYMTVYDNVKMHYSIFPVSVYKKIRNVRLEKIDLISLSKCQKIKKDICIYISSTMHVLKYEEYIKRMRIILNEYINDGEIYFAAHPADSEKTINAIVKKFNLIRLNTCSVLTEDYILCLASEGTKIKLIGEENTTSKLLRLIKSKNIKVETKDYYDIF